MKAYILMIALFGISAIKIKDFEGGTDFMDQKVNGMQLDNEA